MARRKSLNLLPVMREKGYSSVCVSHVKSLEEEQHSPGVACCSTDRGWGGVVGVGEGGGGGVSVR